MTNELAYDGTILVVINPDEVPYLQTLSQYFQGRKVKIFHGEIVTAEMLLGPCRKHGIKQIVTTSEVFLKKLMPEGRDKGAKISNYAGSILPAGGGVEVLILNPLKQLITMSYMKFMTERYLSKFMKPWLWKVTSEFDWEIVENYESKSRLFHELETGFMAGVDIETTPGMRITSCSYTVKRLDFSTRTFVLPVRDLSDIAVMRAANDTRIPKALQNGKYDSAYFHAYSAPLVGYYYDTVNMMHSWYAELPKDLASLAAFYIRDVMYWKDLGDSGDSLDQLKYNGLDTWATVEVACEWLRIAPDWAKKNYVKEFQMVPSCIQMEMTGIKRDMELLRKYNEEGNEKLEKKLMGIKKMVAKPNFNPSSPKQVLALMHVLGDKKAESTDDKSIQKSLLLHPINERILGDINSYRSDRKELSTYIPNGIDPKGKLLNKEFKGRILYSLNPHATDTGRLGARESAFSILGSTEYNCGLQIQNITADGIVKDTFIADEEFEFYEADFRQAEARGVGYCSGDERLLAAVNSTRDFHSLNASAFFGIPYEEIYDDESEKTLDKALRDLSKRVNHGANYNMGAYVMLDTMGIKKVRQAQKLLDLPKSWSLIKVCEHLLFVYEQTYPKVKTLYYQWIKQQVRTNSKLVGATGWTRWCFGDPSKNKMDLNAYIAHVTQSLNAMILNEAVRRVWNKYRLDSDVKFLAQIHDSILFFARKTLNGRAKAEDIKSMMEFPIDVVDCTGKLRTMIVPVDLKCNGYRWSGNVLTGDKESLSLIAA